jgi:hypothetical protein
MSVRGKFKVTKVAKLDWSTTAVEVTLSAYYDSSIPEDVRYAKATPSGSITMLIDNPFASDQLLLGKYFYVDFEPVPEAVAAGS